MYKPRNCHFGRTKVSSWSKLCHPWVTDVGSFLKLQLTNQDMDVCIEEEMSQDLEKGFLALGKIWTTRKQFQCWLNWLVSDSSRGAFCYDLMKCLPAGNGKEEDGSIYFVKLCSQSVFLPGSISFLFSWFKKEGIMGVTLIRRGEGKGGVIASYDMWYEFCSKPHFPLLFL